MSTSNGIELKFKTRLYKKYKWIDLQVLSKKTEDKFTIVKVKSDDLCKWIIKYGTKFNFWKYGALGQKNSPYIWLVETMDLYENIESLIDAFFTVYKLDLGDSDCLYFVHASYEYPSVSKLIKIPDIFKDKDEYINLILSICYSSVDDSYLDMLISHLHNVDPKRIATKVYTDCLYLISRNNNFKMLKYILNKIDSKSSIKIQITAFITFFNKITYLEEILKHHECINVANDDSIFSGATTSAIMIDRGTIQFDLDNFFETMDMYQRGSIVYKDDSLLYILSLFVKTKKELEFELMLSYFPLLASDIEYYCSTNELFTCRISPDLRQVIRAIMKVNLKLEKKFGHKQFVKRVKNRLEVLGDVIRL